MTEMPEKQTNKVMHVVLVLLVFACTGFTLARIGHLIMDYLEIERFSWNYWLMWIALLPLYNIVLLIFGLIFGKYQYMRDKQKRTWNKIKRLFVRK